MNHRPRNETATKNVRTEHHLERLLPRAVPPTLRPTADFEAVLRAKEELFDDPAESSPRPFALIRRQKAASGPVATSRS